MRVVPLLSAAVAAALVGTAAAPAVAEDAPAPGLGSALSTATLAELFVAGQRLEALQVLLPTSTSASGAAALVAVSPLRKDGTDVVDPVVVQAGDEDKSVEPQTEGIDGVLSLTSPSGTVSAVLGEEGPVASVATDVGQADLLGVGLLGEGTFEAVSSVTGTASSSTKSLQLAGLSLPSLLDLLEALGVDLAALPASTLTDLLDLVGLPDGVSLDDLLALLELLDDPAATVGDVVDLLGQTPLELSDLVASPEQATVIDDLTGAIADLEAALAEPDVAALALEPLVLDPVVIGEVLDTVGGVTDDLATEELGDLVSPETLADLEGLVDGIDLGALDADALQALLDELTAVLDEVLDSLLGDLLDGLPAAEDLLGLLDVSLLSVGAIDVSTLAQTGAVDVADVTGTVSDVQVLDAVDLDLDLVELLGDEGALAAVEEQLNGLLGEVTAVLAGADEILGLDELLGQDVELAVPLPQLSLLEVVEDLDTASSVERATAGVDVLSLTWALDELQVPDALSLLEDNPLSLPVGDLGAAALPTSSLAALASSPMELTVGSLSDSATFQATPAPTDGGGGGGTPVTPVTPVANPRPLPATGAPALAAVAGLALLTGAALVRRRRGGAETDAD